MVCEMRKISMRDPDISEIHVPPCMRCLRGFCVQRQVHTRNWGELGVGQFERKSVARLRAELVSNCADRPQVIERVRELFSKLASVNARKILTHANI